MKIKTEMKMKMKMKMETATGDSFVVPTLSDGSPPCNDTGNDAVDVRHAN